MTVLLYHRYRADNTVLSALIDIRPYIDEGRQYSMTILYIDEGRQYSMTKHRIRLGHTVLSALIDIQLSYHCLPYIDEIQYDQAVYHEGRQYCIVQAVYR